MSAKKRSVLGAFTSSIVAATGVSAQESDTVEMAQVRALEEIVVTAQRREQRLQDVPISVDVLTGEAMERAQINTVNDIAAVAPTLNLQGYFSSFNTNFSMRGVGGFAQEGIGIQPAVATVVDGVPLSRVGEFVTDINDIERVELLAGPQGTLFGLNTTGGVLNITTKRATEEFEAYVEGTITSDDEYITRLMLSGPLSPTIRGRVLAYYKDRDGHIENIYPGSRKLGREESYGLLAKLEFDVNDDINIRLGGDYRQVSEGTANVPYVVDGNPATLGVLGNGDPSLGQRIIDDPFLDNIDIDPFSDGENYGVSADVAWSLSDMLTLKSISAYRGYDVDANLIDTHPASVSDLQGMDRAFAVRSNVKQNGDGPMVEVGDEYFSQEVRLEHSSSVVDWIVGGFYQNLNEYFISEVPLVFNGGFFFDNPRHAAIDRQTWSLFGDVTLHTTDRLDLFAGVRWTDETADVSYVRNDYFLTSEFYEISGNFVTIRPGAPFARTQYDLTNSNSDWSGRAGLSLKWTDELHLYASAARGYTGLGVKTSPDASVTSAFVDPTTADSYEIGLKSQLFDNRMRLNVAIFTMDVQNLQARTYDPSGNAFLLENGGDLESNGSEVSIVWQATESFAVNASVAWLDTEMGGSLQPCYEGQTEAEGCFDHDGNGDVEQDIAGQAALNAPELAYTVTADHRVTFDGLPFDLHSTLIYAYRDDVVYTDIYDPIASYQDAYGLLDVTVGIEDKDGRYNVSVFGKNILDEFYWSHTQEADSVGRATGIVSRSAQTYWGVRARVNF